MEKTLRSLIHEKFDLDCRYEIELLSRRRDLVNEEKQEELIKLLQSKNIENIVPLGPGTNRYAFKLDGFVIKVATDHDGKIDNLKEFKMAKRLYPYVTKTYEVSENGTILVAEYIQPYESFGEMLGHADKIREILEKLSAVYLIGDVGITPNNFANWGTRTGTQDPVCLDFAYVYEVSSKLFLCRYCEAHAMLVPNKDFTELHCSNPACGRKYLFEDIRAKIGNDIHRHEIGDLSLEGYKLIQSHTPTVLDEDRSNYLVKKQEVKEEVTVPQEEVQFVDNFVMPQENIMGGSIMSNINEIAAGVRAASNKRNTLTIQVQAVLSDSQATDELQQDVSTGSPEEMKVVTDSMYGEAEAPVKTEVLQTGEEEQPEPESTFAFGGKMIDAPLNGFEVPVVQATAVVPTTVVSAPVVTAEPVNDGKYKFPANIHERRVLENMISEITNRMRHELHLMDAFNSLKAGVRNKKMLAGQFYKSIQNAAFRTLVAFCGFGEHEEEREDKSGKYLVFDPPTDLYGDYMETLIFLCEFTKFIQDHRSMTNEDQMKLYRTEHPQHPGIQREWLPIFERRMFSKMPIDGHCTREIVNIIDKLYCIPTPVDPDPVVPNPPSNDPESQEVEWSDEELAEAAEACIDTHELDQDVFNAINDDDTIERFAIQLIKAFGHKHYRAELDCSNPECIMIVKYVFTINNEDVEILGVANVKEYTLEFHMDNAVIMDISGDTIEEFFDAIIEYNFEEIKSSLLTTVTAIVDPTHAPEMTGSFQDNVGVGDDEDEDGNGNQPLYINVFPDDEYDIIKVVSEDNFGEIAIPFYAQLANVRTEPMDNPNDPRNGMWDFLCCMVPDLMFRTTRPQFFLDLNKEELEENQVKFVILKDEGKDGCIMAIHYIAGIYVCNDEGEMEACFDEELIKKLNRIISEDVSYGRISHFQRSLFMKKLINDESYVLNDVFGGSLEEDDGDDKPELSPEEQAALQIILHGSAALPADASDDDKKFADHMKAAALNGLGMPSTILDQRAIQAGMHASYGATGAEPGAGAEEEEFEINVGVPQVEPVVKKEESSSVSLPIIHRQYN